MVGLVGFAEIAELNLLNWEVMVVRGRHHPPPPSAPPAVSSTTLAAGKKRIIKRSLTFRWF